LNEAELEAWARGFQRLGWQIATEREPADLLVVNTCAVTAEAVRKSRKLLRRLRRTSPDARVIISGCAATLDGEILANEGIDLVVGNTDKDRLVDIATEQLALSPAPHPAPTNDDIDPAEALFARGRQRAFVKVQDGCRYQCSFCVTTIARGAERSRAVADIVSEVQALTWGGVREVILTGVQLGGYGRTAGSESAPRLGELIATILHNTDVARLRLGSLEPWDLPGDFWRLFEEPRLMPHLHMPLQSGSDRVLKRMARRCRTDEFRNLVEQAREVTPDFNIGTDIIAGFPGETDADWQQTLDFVASIGFGQLHIFPYSPRPGTRAADMPSQVPHPVRRERVRQLHNLADSLRADWLDAHVGRRLPVLIEGERQVAEGAYATGYTPNYLPVRLRDAPNHAVGHIVEVDLIERSADGEAIEARPAARLRTHPA
jgi:threonylcarbamoyladenosine tRNA methylthiotransferase MtaB